MKRIFMLFPLVLIVVLMTALGVGGAITFADSECSHDYQIEEVSPTCLKEGYTLYKCSKCGDIYKDNYIDTIPHEYIEVLVEPDCIHKGYTTYICIKCGYSYQDNFVEPLGHELEDQVIDPNCLEQGYTLHTCKHCEYQFKDNFVEPLGHDFESVVTDPDCINGGFTTNTCSRCSYEYVSDFLDPNGHDFIEKIVEPTCSTYGYTEHVCASCNDRYVTDYINPLGHHFVEKEVVATNKTLGYTIYSCDHCDYSYVSKISTSKDDGYIHESHDYKPGDDIGAEDPKEQEEPKEQEQQEIEIIPPVEDPIIPKEDHTHEYMLDIRIKEDKKVATVKYLCECGDIKNERLSIAITNKEGARYDLNINQNYLVDLYPYEGTYSLSIYDDLEEIFNYEINLPKNEKKEEVDPENKEIVTPSGTDNKENISEKEVVEQKESKEKGLSETAKVLIAVFSVILTLAIGGVIAIIVLKKKGFGKKNVK